MSIYAEYARGMMTEDEFRNECAYLNRKERYEEAHMYDDLYDEGEEEDDE